MLWSLLLFFINEEYLIALVDFIAPCGGTKGQGRRDLRIPPSLSEARLRGSLDSNSSTLGNRCGGILGCRGLTGI